MRLVTFAGLVGGYFVVWTVAQSYKVDSAKKRFIVDAAKGDFAETGKMTQLQYEVARSATSAPTRLLNISNFSLDNLDVRPLARLLTCILTQRLAGVWVDVKKRFLPSLRPRQRTRLPFSFYPLAGRAGAIQQRSIGDERRKRRARLLLVGAPR